MDLEKQKESCSVCKQSKEIFLEREIKKLQEKYKIEFCDCCGTPRCPLCTRVMHYYFSSEDCGSGYLCFDCYHKMKKFDNLTDVEDLEKQLWKNHKNKTVCYKCGHNKEEILKKLIEKLKVTFKLNRCCICGAVLCENCTEYYFGYSSNPYDGKIRFCPNCFDPYRKNLVGRERIVI